MPPLPRPPRIGTLVTCLGLLLSTACGPLSDMKEAAFRSASQALGSPDFTVSSVSASPSAMPGGSLNTMVTVCNPGSAGAGTDVKVYLSTDTAITTSDLYVGGAPVPLLNPGQCVPLSISGSASTAGTYYVGAIVDPSGSVAESSETNNTRAGNRVGVGNKPDFTITAVSAPAGVTPSSGFPTTATVCNQGTVGTNANVDVYLSTDASITTADILVGGAGAGHLAPGQCVTLTIPSTATSTAGLYYVGAFADRMAAVSELLENNNTLAGNRVGVGNGPDFVVTAVTAPTGVTGSSGFPADVTVCNQGTAGASTGVDVYQSTDATITTSDFPAGGAPVPYLNPGECASVRVPATSTGTAGAWYVGAYVDRMNGMAELNEGNNTLAGNRMGVGNAPDFTVSSVTGPANVAVGSSFTAIALVCNQGTTGSSVNVTVYLSADANITNADANVGSAPVPPLDPGQCAPVSVPCNATPANGAYYVGAFVDATGSTVELIENNNTRAGNLVGVGNGPDLVSTSVSGPASVLPGQSFNTSVTVCNQGSQGGGNFVEVYVSQDTTLNSLDMLVGSAPLPYLAPGECATANVPSSMAVPPGSYHLGAYVDRTNGLVELVESNNTLSGGRFNVGDGPDFVVTSVTGPASVAMGGSITTTVTVCNQGTAGGGTSVDTLLSVDANITGSDWFGGSAPTPYLPPGECAAVTVNGPASVPTNGAYHLGAYADRFGNTVELLETNNTLAGNLIGVGNNPDLVVASVAGPPSATPGSSFITTVTVCNQGTTSGGAPVDVLLSADATVTGKDWFVGSAPSPYLAPGECAPVVVNGPANVPVHGPYYLGAYVDRFESTQELIETNNARADNLIGIGNNPDLTITAVDGPPSATPGSSIQVSVTVCNQGTTGGGAPVEVLVSSDSTLGANDWFVGSAPTPPLGPGECATVTVNGPANAPINGPYYLGAWVDRFNNTSELIETNNTRADRLIGIGNNPDLIITSVSGPPSAPPGASIPVSVTVCNQGTTGGGAPVEVILSSDTTLNDKDWFVGSAPTPYLDPGRCATVTVNGPANAPINGPHYLGAWVDRFNGTTELIETNNTRADRLIGIGNNPDFIVTSVSGPPSATPGSSIQVSVTVCNQGTTSGGAPVEVLLSSDTTLGANDWLVGSAPSPYLAPGGCATVTVNGPANGPVNGPYYLGAWIDRFNNTTELIETNNTRADAVIGIGNAPDLFIASVSGPPSAAPGSSIQVSVTVCNQGTTGGGAPVEVLLSSDTTLNDKDWFVGSAPTPPLAPGECGTVTVNGPANGPVSGPYYLGAWVDRFNNTTELIETNNTRADTLIGVGNNPDFTVTSISGPPSVSLGGGITITMIVCNQGTTGGGANLEAFLSTDTTPDDQDSFVGARPTPYLGPGQCAPVQVNGPANVPMSGAYHLGAYLDRFNSTSELIESNNALAGPLVGIGNNPDLIITSVSGPASATPGASIPVSVTVCNQGTTGGGAPLEVFLSSDTAVDGQDWFVGSAPTPYLAPGSCVTMTVNGPANAPGGGPYHLGAWVDRSNGTPELIESNNTRIGNLIGLGNNPDFTITSVTGPATARPGSSISVTATVCNQGTAGGGTNVELLLSQDTTLNDKDWFVGSAPTPPLAPGQCATVTVNGTANTPTSGPYHLGAWVDRYQNAAELIETNNTSIGGQIGVGNEADLIVSSVSGPPSAPSGGGMSVTVKVCNQGFAMAGSPVDVFLSADATVTDKDFFVGSAPVPSLVPGQCATLTVNGSAAAPPGTYRLGAFVDRNNGTLEIIETNNTAAPGTLTVN